MENNLKRYLFDYTNDDYYKCDDVDTELTRLRGEVERLEASFINQEGIYEESFVEMKIRAETAEARVKELEAQIDPQALTAAYMVGRADKADQQYQTELLISGERQKHQIELQAQLAELRARVRPSVEEIEKEITKFGNWHWLNGSSTQSCVISVGKARHIAQAIHDILPTVPKVLTVDEMYDIAISEPDAGTLEMVIKLRKAIYGGGK